MRVPWHPRNNTSELNSSLRQIIDTTELSWVPTRGLLFTFSYWKWERSNDQWPPLEIKSNSAPGQINVSLDLTFFVDTYLIQLCMFLNIFSFFSYYSFAWWVVKFLFSNWTFLYSLGRLNSLKQAIIWLYNNKMCSVKLPLFKKGFKKGFKIGFKKA